MNNNGLAKMITDLKSVSIESRKLKEILKLVSHAAMCGKSQVLVQTTLEDDNRLELIRRGFKVSEHHVNKQFFILIEWEETNNEEEGVFTANDAVAITNKCRKIIAYLDEFYEDAMNRARKGFGSCTEVVQDAELRANLKDYLGSFDEGRYFSWKDNVHLELKWDDSSTTPNNCTSCKGSCCKHNE